MRERVKLHHHYLILHGNRYFVGVGDTILNIDPLWQVSKPVSFESRGRGSTGGQLIQSPTVPLNKVTHLFRSESSLANHENCAGY